MTFVQWRQGLDLNKFRADPIYEYAKAAWEAATKAERELSAQTAEWEHRHGTNGIGIAEAIRAGHKRTE